VELPAETAARALRLEICVPMSDPRRKRLIGTGGGYHPERHWLNDLDHEIGPDIAAKPTNSAIEPVSHSAFTPVDRGPGFQLNISREG
jgi:hypothetical protein